MKRIPIVLFLTSVIPVVSCVPAGDGRLSVEYERYELANGLNVVLHIDRSDPIAAVAMAFHAGSSKEVEGRTGFAHLFEHLFFLDSENLGQGGLDRLMNRVGSSANGFTTRDQTNYGTGIRSLRQPRVRSIIQSCASACRAGTPRRRR